MRPTTLFRESRPPAVTDALHSATVSPMKKTVTQPCAAATSPVFCTIIPPHILGRLAESDDPGHHEPARRTLEHAARHRTRPTDLAAPPTAPPAPRAAPPTPTRPT